jgi:hypothetical protein
LSKRRGGTILLAVQSAFIDVDAYPYSGGQMKSILMTTALLTSALAFGPEKQAPEPKPERQSAEQSQPSRDAQGEAIINLSDVPANRASLPVDWTKRALKDKEGLCKVHHEKLRKATVPILYGLMPGPPFPQKTEERLFPNALNSVEAGCIVMPVKEAIVLQCQKCIEAKTSWAKSKQ